MKTFLMIVLVFLVYAGFNALYKLGNKIYELFAGRSATMEEDQ